MHFFVATKHGCTFSRGVALTNVGVATGSAAFSPVSRVVLFAHYAMFTALKSSVRSFWSLKGKKTTTCEIEFLEQQSDKYVLAPCCGIGKHSEHS